MGSRKRLTRRRRRGCFSHGMFLNSPPSSGMMGETSSSTSTHCLPFGIGLNVYPMAVDAAQFSREVTKS